MNTRAAVHSATTRAAHQPGGAPAPRDNSACVSSLVHTRNGGRAGVSQPCRQQNSAMQAPDRRGSGFRAASLSELPGASASGAFRAGVKECLTTEFRSSPGDNTTLPCLRAGIAGGGIRVLMLTDGIRATCQPGDETPRQLRSGQRCGAVPSAVAFAVSRLRCRLSGRYVGDVVVEPDTPHAEGVGTSGRREPQYTQPALESQAKEPFAIPYQAHSMAGDTGGSSRLRPQSGLRVLSCRSRSAAEAQGFDLGCSACAPTAGRSGWKPRTEPSGIPGGLPLSGGARAQMCVVGRAHRLRFRARHQSAARAFSRPVTAKASSKTRLRPRLKRPATLQSRRHAAGPSFWPAFDPSGAVPGSPRLRPGVDWWAYARRLECCPTRWPGRPVSVPTEAPRATGGQP